LKKPINLKRNLIAIHVDLEINLEIPLNIKENNAQYE